MLIHRISADWKDGSGGTLELRDGLNIINAQQPDWGEAFCTLLYGADDKSPERAEMECEVSGHTLTLTQDGDAFRVSGDVSEELTADKRGEVLTGVGREAYENLACVAWDTEAVTAEPVREIESRLSRFDARMEELERREATLNRALRGTESGQAAPVPDGVPDLYTLTAAYAAMKHKLDEDKIPEMDEISHLRGAIVNIMTAGKQLDKAEAEQEAAESVLAAAKADVDATRFAGMTPEEAEQSPLKLPFRPVIPKWLAIAFGVTVALGALFLFHSPGAWYPLTWFLYVGLGILSGWLVRKWDERWVIEAAKRRNQWESDLVRYAELYRVMEEARAAADIKIAATDSLRESLTTNERGILREIHRFAPEVSSMQEADEQLRLCARRRKELSIAEAVVRKAEALEGKSVPAFAILEQPDTRHAATPPERDQLIQALNAVREERSALRLEIRRDREELHKSREAEEQFSESLWKRARVSLDTLSEIEPGFPALELVSRFAELFHALTEYRYAGENRFRLEVLSELCSGALSDEWKAYADCTAPLSLSVCLACFERVFSGDARPPLLLRDIPRGFGEASATVLESMSDNRQILFFAAE
ncbi:MAG: hypothetical protein IJR72_01105 [Oscillospiraceae bacterium]|nr:hypothetical protein [Oscillospiraceae bacterium]